MTRKRGIRDSATVDIQDRRPLVVVALLGYGCGHRPPRGNASGWLCSIAAMNWSPQ